MRGSWVTAGLAEYIERVAKAGQDVDAAAAECIQYAGETILRDMLDYVPVATGDLRDFLKSEGLGPVVREGNETSVEVGLRTLGPSQAPEGHARYEYYEKHVRRSRPRRWAGRFYYGILLEFGTGKMRAQPWFRPAIDQTRGMILRRWREIFRRWGLVER